MRAVQLYYRPERQGAVPGVAELQLEDIAMKAAARVALALIILLEIFGWFFYSEIASDFTWLGLVVTTGFIWAIAEFFRLSVPVMWIVVVSVVVDGLSALFQLYSNIAPWDCWIHAWGGFVIAAAALELVLRAFKKGYIKVRHQGSFIAGSVYMTVATLGFLYEFLEYLVDNIQYGYPRSLVSAYDSIEDQLYNLLGTTILLTIYYLWRSWQKRRTQPTARPQA
jgi:hypothetical protein